MASSVSFVSVHKAARRVYNGEELWTRPHAHTPRLLGGEPRAARPAARVR